MSIVFGVFGISNWVALYASVVIGAFSVFPVFLMVYAVSKNEKIGLIAAMIFPFFPLHMRWSTSAETNVASVFFVALCLFFVFLFFRKLKESLMWLALMSIAFTAQFRPENYLLIPLFLFGWFLYDKRFLIKYHFKLLFPLALVVVLTTPNLVQVLDFYPSGNWVEIHTEGAETGANWSVSNLIYNSVHFGADLFNGKYQPGFLRHRVWCKSS